MPRSQKAAGGRGVSKLCMHICTQVREDNKERKETAVWMAEREESNVDAKKPEGWKNNIGQGGEEGSVDERGRKVRREMFKFNEEMLI